MPPIRLHRLRVEKIGSFGDIVMFSFDPIKLSLTDGELSCKTKGAKKIKIYESCF